MEVLRLKKLGPPILQPLCAGQRLATGAMSVAAAVESDAAMAAVIAPLDMPAERGGAAQFDGRHDATLGNRQRRVMFGTIGLAVAAEHIRHFRP